MPYPRIRYHSSISQRGDYSESGQMLLGITVPVLHIISLDMQSQITQLFSKLNNSFCLKLMNACILSLSLSMPYTPLSFRIANFG